MKKRIVMHPRNLFLLGIILFFLKSCGVQYRSTTFDTDLTSIAYKDKQNWAVFAGKTTDGIAVNESSDILQADVFYIYPTLLTDKKDIRWNAPIHDIIINNDVKNLGMTYQATGWASAARLFVPFYRQNHYRAFFEPYLNNGGKEAQ